MRHGVLRSAILALALCATASLSASQTSLSGLVSGRELCPQSICDAAIFVAGFAGEIDDRPAVGLAVGGIIHETLPEDVGGTAPITGGRWSIRTLRRTLEGDVTGGVLRKLNDTRFSVVMFMDITEGGSGGATFTAILDHGPFPPTIRGVITQ